MQDTNETTLFYTAISGSENAKPLLFGKACARTPEVESQVSEFYKNHTGMSPDVFVWDFVNQHSGIQQLEVSLTGGSTMVFSVVSAENRGQAWDLVRYFL